MEIGAAAAGVSAGVNALWGYNRKNYLFDREMRQKNEYQVLDWRCKQASLWREDIRDIIGLTEKKMDTYTVVSALSLGMSVGLFTEGRLAPGTPPWLLHFYMLTLAAAFLYLLMSVWLAMHASVVAQCSSVRLLTQFVRLPVPTWEELENMRTYAQSFEQLRGKHMLRVPFVTQGSSSPALRSKDRLSQSEPALNEMCDESSATRQSSMRGGGPQETPAADPWQREAHGDDRDLYELQQVPASLRRHIKLAQRAAEQYKCFDAFARVAMTFGTNQLLQAITYYSLGYVSVQDGAPWAAWCVGAIMSTISVVMVHLDISLRRDEQFVAQVLVLAGPVCASCATWMWARSGKEATNTIMTLLAMAYAAHALWLLWALRACGVQRMPCGSVLPTRFRAVLYLDVFGWLNQEEEEDSHEGCASSCTNLNGFASRRSKAGYVLAPMDCPASEQDATGHFMEGNPPDIPDSPASEDMSQLQQDLQEHIALWQSEKVQCVMDEHEKARVAELARRFQSAGGADAAEQPAAGAAAAPEGGLGLSSGSSGDAAAEPQEPSWVKLHGYSDFGLEAPYLYDPESGVVKDFGESPDKVRTITFDEDQMNRFCDKMSTLKQRDSRGDAAPPASRLPATAKEFSDAVTTVSAGLLCCTAGQTKRHELWIPGLESHPEHPEQQWEEEAGELQPSGPSGAIPMAPPRAFEPTSFLPGPREQTAGGVGEGHIVSGHDRVRPGELPWQIFRAATLLLAALWTLGLAVPFEPLREIMTNPVIAEIRVESMGAEGETGVEHFAVGTDPSGLPEYIPENLHSIPELPEGELIQTTWPSHSGFKPRALSRAPHGQQLVVADDFGVYVGQLFAEEVVPVAGVKALRGGNAEEEERPTVVHSVHFRKAPLCAALEGHALKDISVACSEGPSPVCRVLVLHTHGRRLVECPLFSPSPDPPGPMVPNEEGLLPPARPSLMWEISSDWLHGFSHKKRESVESVAVNSECLVGAFNPNKVGCVVVGTTSGRIVQLRGHLTNETRLVPERAVQQWSQAVEHGSLHVFPNGYVVALHKRTGTIEAFDARKGKSVGEWRLPKGVKWMTVSGGGDNFYMMGQDDQDETEFSLYRFPVPEELRSQKEEAALPFASRNF